MFSMYALFTGTFYDINIYIYIYIYREREREIFIHIFIHTFIHKTSLKVDKEDWVCGKG